MRSLPIRIRLTLWHLLLLTLLILLSAFYFLWQTERILLNQLDNALRLSANQILATIDSSQDQPAFMNEAQLVASLDNVDGNLLIQLVTADGEIYQTISNQENDQQEQPVIFPPQTKIVSIYAGDDGDELWRVYSILVPGPQRSPQIWLQTAQTMDEIEDLLVDLRQQILIALPLILLISGALGYFWTGIALQPMQKITETANRITATSNLHERIAHDGAKDEIGHLANTLDQMFARLEESFIREKRFTADAAHELRTPLTALNGQIELLLSRPRSVTEYNQALDLMYEQVQRLIRLSQDLLLIARLEQGIIELETEIIDFSELLPILIEQVAPLYMNKKIVWQNELPPSLLSNANIDLLIRLFFNLFDNAIKYTPENGRITLSATRIKEQIIISLSNSGVGIDPKHLPHLFKRFYRVEQGRTRQKEDAYSGSGLGLAIAYEIARLHNGTITAESELNQTTTFTLILPA